MLSRRELLAGALAVGTGLGIKTSSPRAQGQESRRGKASGAARDERSHMIVDKLMGQLLEEFQIAGACLAIAHHGRLLVSKGYGLANVAKHDPVRPDTVFSIASVTKAITGVGILKLVDEGSLELDARVVEVLSDLKPLPGERMADPRFRLITIRHLLQHAGGLPGHIAGLELDEGDTEDENPEQDAKAALRYRTLLGQPLEFAPGSKSRYSNIGFVVLRLVIEQAAKQPYEEYIVQRILKPMDVSQMHLEREGDYEPNEAHRYQPGGHKPAPRQVANWLASAADLVGFLIHVAGSSGKSFLSKKAIAAMLAPPRPPIKVHPNGAHVGLGWDSVRQFPEGYRFSKNGGKPGIQAWLEHMENGIDWAFLYNTGNPKGRNCRAETVRRFHGAFRTIIGNRS